MCAEIADLSITDASNTARFPESQAPSTVNNGARALEGLIARALKDTVETNITSTGSANAYVVAANRTLTAYYTGLRIAFKTNFANTGAATVNVDALGAKNIFKRTSSGVAALASGDIQSGDVVDLIYDGTQFQLLATVSNYNPASVAITGGTITGITDLAVADGGTGASTAATARTALGAVGGTGVTKVEAIRKATTETVNNSTALQDDNELTIAIAANETIYFDMTIAFNSSTVADFKLDIAGPAGVAGQWIYVTGSANSTDSPWNPLGGSGAPVNGLGTDKSIIVRGIARNGATAGNVRLQWAQNTAEVSDTKVLADSFVIVWRV